MKKIIFGIGIISLLTSCGKFTHKATIERDCTGTYIEINNRDYLVCNPSMVSSYSDGSSIKVKYTSVFECPTDSNTVVCELYHKNYGMVKITEIK